MSDFWSKALGGSQPSTPRTAPQAVIPARNDRPWWQTSFVTTASPQQQYAEPPAPAIQQAPVQAKSARATERCPNCNSGNYTKGDTSGSMTRCFECGYNPRFDQMAFAATGGIPSTATRQAASTNGGFHPQQIVDKVG